MNIMVIKICILVRYFINENFNKRWNTKKADKMHSLVFKRFVAGYKLTEEELAYFKNKYKKETDVLYHLIYYYEDKDIYKKLVRR